MRTVLVTTWPLLLGVMLLMVGNGMQGTLLGIRGGLEGIPTGQMSIVMSAYFAGFLVGSRTVPGLIHRVGHVRVFAALGSLISAVLIIYAAAPNWVAWTVLRMLIGFCFSGVYITSESWLNESSTNATRGQTLSAYLIVQMLGIISAQLLLNVGDPGGWILFVIPSVLVSLAFTPILLSVQPAPNFETIKRMSMAKLYRTSPLGCVGVFLMGGVFAAFFGMGAVWGAAIGLSVPEISAFIAAFYTGGALFQFPLGWLSDRTDRRLMILVLALIGCAAVMLLLGFGGGIWSLILVAIVLGGVVNPIYGLLLAYTNDFLDYSDMASGSAGLLFLYGLGSMTGPLAVGWLMGRVGNNGFWYFILALMIAQAAYCAWRMTQRAAIAIEDAGSVPIISPSATTLAVEAAMDFAQNDAVYPDDSEPPEEFTGEEWDAAALGVDVDDDAQNEQRDLR